MNAIVLYNIQKMILFQFFPRNLNKYKYAISSRDGRALMREEVVRYFSRSNFCGSWRGREWSIWSYGTTFTSSPRWVGSQWIRIGNTETFRCWGWTSSLLRLMDHGLSRGCQLMQIRWLLFERGKLASRWMDFRSTSILDCISGAIFMMMVRNSTQSSLNQRKWSEFFILNDTVWTRLLRSLNKTSIWFVYISIIILNGKQMHFFAYLNRFKRRKARWDEQTEEMATRSINKFGHQYY